MSEVRFSKMVGRRVRVRNAIENEHMGRQLLRYYRSFDKDFFSPFFYNDLDRHNRECAERYRAVLDDEVLEEVLMNEAHVQEIPHETMLELAELACVGRGFLWDLVNHEVSSFESLMRRLDLNDTSELQKMYFGGRAISSINRLAFPEVYDYRYKALKEQKVIENHVNPEYVKNYVQYTLTQPLSQHEADQILEVSGKQTEDSKIYWHIAPYINDELKRYGIDTAQSIHATLDWAKEAAKRSDRYYAWDRYGPSMNPRRFGMQDYHYLLSYDERMPSHLLSRLVAKYVSRRLLESDDGLRYLEIIEGE